MQTGLLVKNIKCLVQVEESIRDRIPGDEMSGLNTLNDAFLYIRNGIILDLGLMKDLELTDIPLKDSGLKHIDADGKHVFPSFCDSHTHLVYAGSRETEFADRIKGLSYEEIAGRGGGILNSAKLLHETSEDDLYYQSMSRIREIILSGTGAVEIKSGYGLNLEDELKMLRVIRRIRESAPLEIKATFLGAHAVPREYAGRRKEYVDLVINEMIPVVASEGLADFIDVFCDRGFFTPEDTERILMAGIKYGLAAKLHANELGFTGGVEAGVKYNAISVDHLECTGENEIGLLKNSGTIPTLLPGSAFFLGLTDPPAGSTCL
jgi:imidazolonepropionase